MKSADQKLAELALDQLDTREIRSRLAHLGYVARLMLKGPHDRIQFNCAAGGKGMMCSHVWWATPMEAIKDGCPHCKLEHHIKHDPPEEVDEAVLVKAVKAQHKAIAANLKKAKARSHRGGNDYGVTKYTI